MLRAKNACWGLLLGFVLGVLSFACSDDFGTPCRLPPSSEIAQFCGESTDPDGNVSTATCLDPINADCETRLCVSFQGSDAFCSQRCSSDGGCPSGSRCESALGSSILFCVPDSVDRL